MILTGFLSCLVNESRRPLGFYTSSEKLKQSEQKPYDHFKGMILLAISNLNNIAFKYIFVC